MELNILTGINWDAPSKQNLIDLYVTRMDFFSYAVGLNTGNAHEPSPYLMDDVRSFIMSATNLSVEKYNSLIEEAIHILNEDGIPELFLSDAYWDSWDELFEIHDYDRDGAYAILYDLYYRYIELTKENNQKFFDIVQPKVA